MRNPIVEEIRRIRQEHARKFHFDLDAIFEDLKDKERKSGRKTVTLKPRRPKPAHSGK
jgi:hypothetical protein